MKTNIRFFLGTILLSIFISFNASAQIAISNINEIPKVKNGITYIAMKDPNSKKSKEYVDLFKKYWTFSKFEFIKYSEIENHLTPESSFLSIGGYVTEVHSQTLYANGSSSGGIDYAHTHIYLELWTCGEKYLKSTKSNKKFKEKDKLQIARVELFTDFQTLMAPENLYQNNYDSDGHIRNWGLGILKNHIQNLTVYLNKNTEQKLYSTIYNQAEVKKLSTETLYIPNYILTKFNKFTGDESKSHEEKELMEEYKSKYKIITTAELNAKILNETTPFYYLQYIKSSTDKFVSVINSSTGEIVYSFYTPISYNIRPSDFKDLQKKI
ncbi:MAG: hypothetical protein V4548_11805 [Bacteroidota bacterium]